MRKLITVLMLLTLVVGAAESAAAQVSIGIRIGPPPPLRAVRIPPPPRPNVVFVPGYWQPRGPRYVWRNGYWAQPPSRGAYWVQPRYSRGRYYTGYWDSRGPAKHGKGKNKGWKYR